MNLHRIPDLIKGKDKFTKEDALARQAKQLAAWKVKLQPWAYALLEAEAQMQNETLPNDAVGWDVWRGDAITMFVVADIPNENPSL